LTQYDLIVVGGGLAGASLARAMAAAGARALVLEHERRFRDRVRGEGMHPWGIAEARALRLDATLVEAGAREVQFWSSHRGGNLLRRRDLVATSPARAGEMTFYHPAMQEHLLELAAAAGAQIRRGVTVIGLNSGSALSVIVDSDGVSDAIAGRWWSGPTVADRRHGAGVISMCNTSGRG
jgi:menaquinone-9 beta-reductase